jgi:choline dehydrogenase-like flavoprotein
MSEDQFDVIVVGAGMAGLACAAELTLRGKRPLLICETKEVAQTLHTVWVDGNRGLMHHPSIQTGWGGGWWNHLVRQLDIDVNVTHFCATLDATVRGSGVITTCRRPAIRRHRWSTCSPRSRRSPWKGSGSR